MKQPAAIKNLPYKVRAKTLASLERAMHGSKIIYPNVVAIEARKPGGQLYRHDFEGNAPVIGLADGSVLILRTGKPLWGK